MTPAERNKVRQLAADNHKGDLNHAALEFLGLKPLDDGSVPIGNEAAVNGIVCEVETTDDAEARAEIPAKKAAAKGK